MYNYKIITDSDELNNFIQFLDPLKDSETHYFSLLARDKYIRDLNIGTFHSDKHQCARWVGHDLSRIPAKLKQLECSLGAYQVKGIEVPQEALACYMTINPRSQTKAAKMLLRRMADVVSDNEKNVNVYQESLTALHKSISRKIYVDVDFDNVDLDETLVDIKDIINIECAGILLTRGGFHVLIRLDGIENRYVKSWYKCITSLPGADIAGDTLIPIPGTYQGGHTPRLIRGAKFK